MTEPIIIKKPKPRGKRTKKFRQLGLIIFTLVVMTIIILFSYKYFFPQEEEFILDFYTYTNVTKKDFLDSISASGTIKPELILDIKSKAAASVVEILASEGEDIKAGETIIRLYSPELYDAQNKAMEDLEQAKTALTQLIKDQEYELFAARRKVSDAEEKVESAQANLELQAVLYKYGTIARIELEKAEKELAHAEQGLQQAEHDLETTIITHFNALEQAEKSVSDAEQELDSINQDIDNLVITAPISGRILALNTTINAQVKESEVLAEIADLSTQLVELDISASQAERFDIGTNAHITVGRSEYPAAVSYIAPQARQSQDGKSLVKVNLKLKTDPSHLRPFSTASVNIHLGMYKDSLCLPRGPYLTSGQQLFVYRIENSNAVRTDVQFGMLQGNYIQILGGLDAGDSVITSSYDQFRHFEKIKILPEGGREL